MSSACADAASIASIVAALVEARRSGKRASADAFAGHLRGTRDAYRVQQGVADALRWFDGAGPRNWKTGGSSRDGEITHAPLAPAGVRASGANLADLKLATPMVEAEIALRIGRALDGHDVQLWSAGASSGHPDVAAIVDAMCVAIEIVDFRWQQASDAEPLLKLADHQSHGALVLGPWTAFVPDHDWSRQRCEVRVGSNEPSSWIGTHGLGDPAWPLASWLRYATEGGQSVAAGTVVTTGSWVGMLAAKSGDEVSVRFDGIGEASLRL